MNDETFDERIKRIVKYWGYDNYKEIYKQEFDDEYNRFYSYISNVVKNRKSDVILVEQVLSYFTHTSNILFNYGAIVLFNGMINFISDIIKEMTQDIQVKTNFRKDTNEMVKLVGKFDPGVKETIEFVSIYILEDEKKKKEILSEFSDRKIKNYEKSIKFEIIKQEKYLKQQPIQEEKQYPQLEENITQRILDDSENIEEIKLNLEKNINENIVEKMNDEKQQAMNEKMAKLRAMRKINKTSKNEEKKQEDEENRELHQRLAENYEKMKKKIEDEEKKEILGKYLKQKSIEDEEKRLKENQAMKEKFEKMKKEMEDRRKKERLEEAKEYFKKRFQKEDEEKKKEDEAMKEKQDPKQVKRERMAKARAMRKTRSKTTEKKNDQEYKITLAPVFPLQNRIIEKKNDEDEEYKIPIAPFSAFKKLKPEIQGFRNNQNVEIYENFLYNTGSKKRFQKEPDRSYNKVKIRGDNLLEKSSRIYSDLLENQRKTLYDYLK